MINKAFISDAGKFIVIGGLSTCLNYGTFYGLYHFLHVNYLVSSVSGYLTGLVFGFFLNNFWTFKADSISLNKTLGYGLVYMVSLGLSTAFLWFAVTKLHFNASVMNLAAIVISTVTNFIGLKYIIYNPDVSK